MEEVGAAIKEIIHYKTIRGKFSSVHPDLAAEGITRVEVGEEGLHFIKTTGTGSICEHLGLNFYLFRCRWGRQGCDGDKSPCLVPGGVEVVVVQQKVNKY